MTPSEMQEALCASDPHECGHLPALFVNTSRKRRARVAGCRFGYENPEYRA